MLVMRTSVGVRWLLERGADSPARYVGEPDYTPAASDNLCTDARHPSHFYTHVDPQALSAAIIEPV